MRSGAEHEGLWEEEEESFLCCFGPLRAVIHVSLLEGGNLKMYKAKGLISYVTILCEL